MRNERGNVRQTGRKEMNNKRKRECRKVGAGGKGVSGIETVLPAEAVFRDRKALSHV